MTKYDKATKETLALVERVKSEFHERLCNVDVKVGVIMAFATINEATSEKDGPALKGYGGAPAAAKIAVVSLKDRLVKNYDVELIIDGDSWMEREDAERVALLDHELTHIEITGKVDDLGRPKVKMREEDFIVWGFLEVVQRHGRVALEAQSVKNLIEAHGQLLLGIEA